MERISEFIINEIKDRIENEEFEDINTWTEDDKENFLDIFEDNGYFDDYSVEEIYELLDTTELNSILEYVIIKYKEQEDKDYIQRNIKGTLNFAIIYRSQILIEYEWDDVVDDVVKIED